MKKFASLVFVLSFVFVGTGCATLSNLGKMVKGWVSGKDEIKITSPRFSEQENLRAGSERHYKRMNRSGFEEEAELKAEAGSLWVMEGQGAYLFSQNQIRMVGDLLNVRIEGGPKSQLQTKVRVIGRLLERLENPQRGLAQENRAQAAPQTTPTPAPGQTGTQAQSAGGDNNENNQNQAQSAQPTKADPSFSVQAVPTRIVEQLKDGSYRVRGMQPFMIGKREYKVIVTGIVRAEDFDDAGIDGSKLLDPQFDIVSSKKGAAL